LAFGWLVLEPFGLRVTEGAKVLGVSRAALSALVKEQSDLSMDMAIRLAQAFGGTRKGWMRVQHQYDIAHMDERARQIKVKPFKGELVSV